MLSGRSKPYMAILAVFAMLATGSVQATNGYAMHGIGAKSKAMAGSGAALAQDTMVMGLNPAGIVHLGKRLDAGIALFSPRREYSVSGLPSGAPGSFGLAPGSVDSDSNYFPIPYVGYTRPIDNNSSWGIAAFGNGGMNTDYPGFANAFCPGGTMMSGPFCMGSAGIDLKQLFITPSYARKLDDGNTSVGVSLVAVAQMFKARGLEAFGAFGFSSDPANLSGNGTDISTGIGVRLAAMSGLVPGLTAALSWQPKISMSDFDDYAGLFADGGNFDIPANINLGLAWQASSNAVVTFDIQRIAFSDVDSVGNSVTQITVNGNLFGTANGPGFGWDDMTVYKLGYQWTLPDMPGWTWRAGISHADQPIGSGEVTLNILAPAVVDTHFAAGFTRELDNDSELSLSLMYAPSQSVSGSNAFDPGQTVEIEMSQFELELGYSWKF